MKIVVCIKQVPAVEAVKLDPKTNTMIRTGVPAVINPDDKVALEAALRLRETVGGTVAVVSMGPVQADVALREALAMGADEAYLLSDHVFAGADTYVTAAVLAAALKKIGFDLVIAGRQSADGETGQVGPQVAERLGVPQITCVEDLSVEGTGIVARSRDERGERRLKVCSPCLVTVLPELAQPRHMSTWGIVDAYNKEIPVWGIDDLKDAMDSDEVGMNGSPTRMLQTFGRKTKAAGTVKRGLSADEAVAAIMDKLMEDHLI